MEQRTDQVVAPVAEPQCDTAQMFESAVDRFGWPVRGSRMIEVGQDIGPTTLEGCPQAPEFFELIRNRACQGVDESVHELLTFPRWGSIGGDRVLIELPTHQQGSMIVGGEDRVEAVLLLAGKQTDAGANRFADPVQVITRPSSATVQLCL